jgi:hypothetical protein
MNTHPSPREDNVREYIKSLQRRDAVRNREQFIDKGRDTLLDGYSEEQFERVCRELWSRGAVSSECYFRTLVDLLLGHYMLARGGDRRAAEISDLFTFEFLGEGPTRCFPVILTTRAGKTNQHGRLETAGALRSRKPLTCLLSGLAFYFLVRWDLTPEPFPDFSSRPAWYETRLIKGNGIDRTAEFSYNSQREWVAKAFNFAGITSKKKTHLGRSAGAKTAELKGVSEEQIRRAGRWNQEQMIGCYLNSLPREFMRSMAGHPSQRGCFEVRQAVVTPPDVLLSLIWPGLDVWKNRFGPGVNQINDLAAMGLTGLLFHLREVVLQDSVVLQEMFPGHPVWNHPVFRHPAYAPFADQLRTAIRQKESPSQLEILYQALPVLTDYLQSAETRAEQRTASIQSSIDRVAEIQSIQTSQLRLLTSGNLTFRLELASPSASASALRSVPTLGTGPLIEEESRYASARASTGPPTRISSPVAATVATATALGMLPPKYRMCREVKTVEGLWREWTEGLQGQPSIRDLDGRWASRWRAGCQSEQQWYSLRLEVMKEIQRITRTERIAEIAAMWKLHVDQQRMSCSLDRFCKRLRISRKSRKD